VSARPSSEAVFLRLFGPEFGHGKAFSLEPLRAALTALGEPQRHLPPVIHVAGTNGKGSTIAFMRAIAEAADLSVHVFTKPHLLALNERFLIAGRLVDDATLITASERVAATKADLTQFDAQVAAALLMFGEAPADVVLLETGMGGRDDSTNVIDAPALSVITPLGIDHLDALGPDLTSIAAHKAGIIKHGVPAIVARQEPSVLQVIEAHAQGLEAPLFRQGSEWDAFTSNGRLVVQTEARVLDLPLPTLFGPHQIDNAGVACAALSAWRNLDDDAFATGVRTAASPARQQPLTRGAFSRPIRDLGGEVWTDGGHNAHAAQALAHALSSLQRRASLPVIAIVGLRARKDADAFIAALAPGVDQIIGVPLVEAHVPPDDIAALARAHGIQGTIAASLTSAMKNAALSPAPRVVICGSFLLAAEALAAERA
jgi:dihydrofolate synthase/folylpolyglutamate synthase